MKQVSKKQVGGSIVLDLLTDFIPVIGEGKAAFRLIQALNAGQYGLAALEGLGILPGGRLISKSGKLATKLGSKGLRELEAIAKKFGDVSHDLRKAEQVNEAAKSVISKHYAINSASDLLSNLAERTPFVDKALRTDHQGAKQLVKNLEQVANGNFTFVRYALTPEEAAGRLLLPQAASEGFEGSLLGLINYGRKNQKTIKKTNKLFTQTPLIGLKGTRGAVGEVFVPNKQLVKNGIKVGTFTSSSPITAIYYSGFGKPSYMKQMRKLADELPPQAKKHALDKLDEIESIFEKYPRQASANTRDLGNVAEELINPKTLKQAEDQKRLELAVSDLFNTFGHRNINGVQELYIPKQTPNMFTADFRGNSFGTPTALYEYIRGADNKFTQRVVPMQKQNTYIKSAFDQDRMAQYVGSGDKSAVVINNIIDANLQGRTAFGAGDIANDIVINPKYIQGFEFKQGGQIKLIPRR